MNVLIKLRKKHERKAKELIPNHIITRCCPLALAINEVLKDTYGASVGNETFSIKFKNCFGSVDGEKRGIPLPPEAVEQIRNFDKTKEKTIKSIDFEVNIPVEYLKDDGKFVGVE